MLNVFYDLYVTTFYVVIVQQKLTSVGMLTEKWVVGDKFSITNVPYYIVTASMTQANFLSHSRIAQ